MWFVSDEPLGTPYFLSQRLPWERLRSKWGRVGTKWWHIKVFQWSGGQGRFGRCHNYSFFSRSCSRWGAVSQGHALINVVGSVFPSCLIVYLCLLWVEVSQCVVGRHLDQKKSLDFWSIYSLFFSPHFMDLTHFRRNCIWGFISRDVCCTELARASGSNISQNTLLKTFLQYVFDQAIT